MTRGGRPKVWIVDDREENRRRFADQHRAEFDVRTFENPDELLGALRDEHPDALLCDIFFYPNAEDREAKEARVAQKAKQIENLSKELHADKAADGIGLIARVRDQFGGKPPFPIYAWTSKGPYLLHNESFDRLEELEARWLFKGRYSPQVERHRISRDIATFQEQNQWTTRIRAAALKAGIVGAFIGGVLGVILDRLLKYIAHI